jgi:predicted Rossmann fold flavoprotein
MTIDAIIIGGGASGLMCAVTAARRGKKVVVLEHARGAAQKVLVSGGGRCNFSNTNISADNFVSKNPDFCRSAISRYATRDILAFMDRHKISYVEKDNGQLFCNGSARLIVGVFLKECRDHKVKLITGCEVQDVSRGRIFTVKTDKGSFSAPALVVASGGVSYQKLGATGIGYDIARQFGLNVNATRPGLVPFVLKKADREYFGRLAGVSVNVELKYQTRRFNGGLLFTHKGLSGPVILQTSLYWEPGEKIVVDFLPGQDIHEDVKAEHGRGSRVLLKNYLGKFLPISLAEALCKRVRIEQKPLASYSSVEIQGLAPKLRSCEIVPAATEDFETAEVTLGGVDTTGISSKTFESEKVEGLYFVGEVLDVTGQLGGYNLHWAWASGHAAGENV